MGDDQLYGMDDLTDQDRVVFRNYFEVRELLTKFENNARLSTFQFLFGKEEGERLLEHFRSDKVRGQVTVFETYLTRDQKNTFYITIYMNKHLLFK